VAIEIIVKILYKYKAKAKIKDSKVIILLA